MASARAGHLVEVPGPHLSVMAGLNCGEASPVAWPWVSAGFDWFTAGGDDLAVTGMRRLAEHGVVSGESGACTVGLLAALAAGAGHAAGLDLDPTAVVLVLSTEGATDPAFYRDVVGRSAEEVAAMTDTNAIRAAMPDRRARVRRSSHARPGRPDDPFAGPWPPPAGSNRSTCCSAGAPSSTSAPASCGRPTSAWSARSSPACTSRPAEATHSTSST